MKNLIIVSGSRNVRKEPSYPIRAIDRFQAGFVKQLRTYYDKLSDFDVLILSPIYGLVSAEEKIAYREPLRIHEVELKLTNNEMKELREASLAKLQQIFAKTMYEQIYVNVGRSLLKVIDGFAEMVPKTTQIIYSEGNGIGPKMAHMRNWLRLNTANEEISG